MSFDIRPEMDPSVKIRIKVEEKVAKRIIADLIAAGYFLGVYDGEETTIKHSQDADALLAAMATTDEDYLLVYHKATGNSSSFVRFIYGNDGWDVVNDYGTSLEPIMDPINEWAEAGCV